MPPLPPEIRMLIESLMVQVQQLQNSNDQTHIFVQGEVEKARIAAASIADRAKIELNERIDDVYDDMKGLHNDLKEIKDVKLVELERSLVKNQDANYKRIIAAQGAIILLFISGVITAIAAYLHH